MVILRLACDFFVRDLSRSEYDDRRMYVKRAYPVVIREILPSDLFSDFPGLCDTGFPVMDNDSVIERAWVGDDTGHEHANGVHGGD